ncbi:MAG TPA: hypothetical protein VE967_12535 [Gemmatimonadaceae bacterium]|nr:hypothetical protein [Gemmatimonadaceae bacterium]
MYSTCLFCHAELGRNDAVEGCLVGTRLAFDPAKGRLWVVCAHCGRWNLTALDERWEPIERCEQLFRDTWQRFTIDNIGLARTKSRLELIRIGAALTPEVASWRYGSRLERRLPAAATRGRLFQRGGRAVARRVAAVLARGAAVAHLSEAATLKLSTLRRTHAVLARGTDDLGNSVVVRYQHLASAMLIRPERGMPWRVNVAHDGGRSTLAEGPGLITAGRLLAVLNFAVVSNAEVRWACAKLGDAVDPTGFFTRIASLALRTEWGRHPDAVEGEPAEAAATSVAERLALGLASRSFWGYGGTSSKPSMPLYRLPSANRLALEMAANEDVERRALAGELADLANAWREAEEIAAISDGMFADDALEEFKQRYYERLRASEHA